MRIGIVGSRRFPDLAAVARYVRSLPRDTVVVTGGAEGVDSVAERVGMDYGLTVQVYRAEWSRYGNKAGPIRNQQIIDHIDRLVAFWDGESPGTAQAIAAAETAKVPVVVYRP